MLLILKGGGTLTSTNTAARCCCLHPPPQVVAFQDDAAPVQPGAAQVYRFKVQASAGPGPSEPAAKLYLYR